MEIQLKRRFIGSEYTIGAMSINGVYLCDTLEPVTRGEKKIAPKTAIPYGRYEVRLTMSARFGRVLPLLINVPSFEGVRIHRGNSAKDTAGCILPGENKVKGRVINSTGYELKIVDLLRKAEQRKEKTFIEIEEDNLIIRRRDHIRGV